MCAAYQHGHLTHVLSLALEFPPTRPAREGAGTGPKKQLGDGT